jgi:hypothetical protein
MPFLAMTAISLMSMSKDIASAIPLTSIVPPDNCAAQTDAE